MDDWLLLFIFASFFFTPSIYKKAKNNLEQYKLRKKAERELCLHGVAGGKLGKCPECVKEKQEEQRKSQIKLEANELKENETKRLVKCLLKKEKYLLSISSKEFEDKVTELFRERGFSIEQTPYVNDGGKDAIGFKDGKKYLFEYKQYSKNSIVGRPDIQKFYAAIVEEEADGGYFVTTNRFSKNAVELSDAFGITLIGNVKLTKMFEEVYPTDISNELFKVMCLECGSIVEFSNPNKEKYTTCQNGHIVKCNLEKPNFEVKAKPSHKICKLCGSKMVRRKGKYGKFWGCSRYPFCKYTESINEY